MDIIEKVKLEFSQRGFPIIYEWFDKPKTVYVQHEHQGNVSFYIIDGGLAMKFGDKELEFLKEDKFDVPIKTQHSAIVDEKGCKYIVGQMIKNDA
jgi:anti-sigma factor ChrR (cupin superfamily)